ncbi:MAG: caspase family protein, partial [Bacteroidota bacterium]
MENGFAHGFALLIGVNEQQAPDLFEYRVPGAATDIQALQSALQDQCGYPPENITVLSGASATRDNILQALDDLAPKLAAHDPEKATAFIYFVGPSHIEQTDEEAAFRLMPYDAVNPVNQDGFEASTIADHEWAQKVAGIHPERLLMLMDCCHPRALQIKGEDTSSTEKKTDDKKDNKKPTDEGIKLAGPKPIILPSESIRWSILNGESSSIVFQSCQDEELSLEEGGMRIFTQHLIEALTGQAPTTNSTPDT